jgi:hypothetical protein
MDLAERPERACEPAAELVLERHRASFLGQKRKPSVTSAALRDVGPKPMITGGAQ